MLNGRERLVLILWATMGGCGGGPAAEIRTSEYPVGRRWTATLATRRTWAGRFRWPAPPGWRARTVRAGGTPRSRSTMPHRAGDIPGTARAPGPCPVSGDPGGAPGPEGPRPVPAAAAAHRESN